MNEIILFASQFVTVALLVIQSQNNVHGRFWLAAGTSLLIGVAQLVPMIVFILPTLFIVLLGPAIIQVLAKFK